MDSVIKFLYDRAGGKVAVQLMYDEYLRLSDFDKELPLLRVKIRQIAELLQGESAPRAPAPPERVIVRETTPEPTLPPPRVQAPVPAPEMAPTIVPTSTDSLREDVLTVSNIKLPADSPGQSTVKEYAMPIPPVLLDFLTEQDPSQKAKRLIMTCAQKLSGLCGKRITLSLHKPYICLWDFDEWKTFAFGEIIQGDLYISMESSLQPHADTINVWIPPSGLCKKPLVRRRVDAITDELLEQLINALNHLVKPATVNI